MMTRKVRFYRNLKGYYAGSNGGNLKLRDAFDHIDKYSSWDATIYFSKESELSDFAGNYWKGLERRALDSWIIEDGDICFISGKDWEVLPRKDRLSPPVPIINIVQPRHIRLDDPRNEYLKHPAIRIAKSKNGAKILKEYGVNGPVYLIPDAIDLTLLPSVSQFKDIDILIIGLKQPKLAKSLYKELKRWAKRSGKKLKIEVQLPPKLATRMDFLNLLNRSKMSVCIPLADEKGGEGFYLPALEAMALESLVVTHLAIGNLDHCTDDVNCLISKGASSQAYMTSIQKAYDLTTDQRNEFISNGLQTAKQHEIGKERQKIIDLVDRAYDIWAQYFIS